MLRGVDQGLNTGRADIIELQPILAVAEVRDDIAPIAALEFKDVTACTARQNVIAATAVQRVTTRATIKVIIAPTTIDIVVAIAAKQPIMASAAVDIVIAAHPIDQVVAAPAVKIICKGRTLQGIRGPVSNNACHRHVLQ